jgi:photosystem II stability/assembly factor-like uncharacterized protein
MRLVRLATVGLLAAFPACHSATSEQVSPASVACSPAAGTWTLLRPGGSPAAAVSVGADPLDPSVLYAVTDSGLFTSKDGGHCWAGPLRAPLGTEAITVAPSDPSVLYAAGGTDGELFGSDDGGRTWKDLHRPGTIDVAVDPSDPRRLLVSQSDDMANHAAARSNDGGTTWTVITAGIATRSPGIDSFAFDPAHHGVAYAASGGRVYRSTDDGTSWTPTGLRASWWQFLSGAPAHRFLAFGVRDSGENKFSPQAAPVFESTTDGGMTWHESAARIPPRLEYLAVDPTAPDVMVGLRWNRSVFAGPWAVYRSADRGRTWTAIGPALEHVYATGLSVAGKGGQSILVTTDKGVFDLSLGASS